MIDALNKTIASVIQEEFNLTKIFFMVFEDYESVLISEKNEIVDFLNSEFKIDSTPLAFISLESIGWDSDMCGYKIWKDIPISATGVGASSVYFGRPCMTSKITYKVRLMGMFGKQMMQIQSRIFMLKRSTKIIGTLGGLSFDVPVAMLIADAKTPSTDFSYKGMKIMSLEGSLEVRTYIFKEPLDKFPGSDWNVLGEDMQFNPIKEIGIKWYIDGKVYDDYVIK